MSKSAETAEKETALERYYDIMGDGVIRANDKLYTSSKFRNHVIRILKSHKKKDA